MANDPNSKPRTLRELLTLTIARLENDSVADEEVDRLRGALRNALTHALAEHAHTADVEAAGAVAMRRSNTGARNFAAAEAAGVAVAESAIAKTIARSEDARGADDDAPPLSYGEQRELDLAHAKHGYGVLLTQWIEDAAHTWRQMTARGYTRVPLGRFIELELTKKYAQRPGR